MPPRSRQSQARTSPTSTSATGESPDPELAETPSWTDHPVGPSPSSPWARASDAADTPGGSTSATSSPASTDEPHRYEPPPRPDDLPPPPPPRPLSKATEKGIQAAAENGFLGIGEALNGLAAEDRSPLDERGPDDIWLATEQEAKGVSAPAGRILARRVPELPGGQADDAGDLIALAIPLGLYLFRNGADQLRRLAGRRRAQRLLAQSQAQGSEAGQ